MSIKNQSKKIVEQDAHVKSSPVSDFPRPVPIWRNGVNFINLHSGHIEFHVMDSCTISSFGLTAALPLRWNKIRRFGVFLSNKSKNE